MKNQIRQIFRPSLAWGTAHRVCTFALQLLCAWLVSRVLESAIAESLNHQNTEIVLAALSVLLGGILLGLLSRKAAHRQADDLRQFRKHVCLAVIDGDLDIPSSGELDVRLQRGAETIQQFFSQACPQMIAAGLTLFISFTILCFMDFRLAGILLGLSLLQLLPTLLYEKWAKAIYAQTQADEEAYSNWVIEGMKGISSIKAFQREKWFIHRFQKHCESLIQSGMKENGTAAIEDIVTEAVRTILSYGSYLIIGAFILFGGADPARLPLLLVMAQRLFSSAASIVNGRTQQAKYRQALTGFAAVKRSQIDRTAPHSTVAVSAAHIQKSYEGKTVLSDASIEIMKHEHVLFQGENGAGKTTLLRILLGLCVPDHGTLLRSNLSMAFAFQEEPALPFPAQEIADQLIRDGTINEADFYRHMKAFRNTAMLSSVPAECSAGQRKKFYVSIALARNAELLALDEPTNHMDFGSVAYLLEQLKAYSGTLLVCSHDSRLRFPWNHTYQVKEGMLHEA